MLSRFSMLSNLSRKCLWIVVLVPLLIALGAIGIRVLPVSASGTQEVPFTGSYSGTAAFTSATSVTFSGTGISTLLGRGTSEGISVVSGPESSCPGGLANENHETLTAANGDMLLLDSADVACPMSPGTFHGTGHWVVTGGTGRFSGASGHGTLDGHSDFNQGVFSFQVTGTLSVPNQG